MAAHAGAHAVSRVVAHNGTVGDAGDAGHAGHAAVRVVIRVLLAAMLVFLAVACTTDPPTEPLIPVFGVTISGAPADRVMLDGASVQLTATALGPTEEPLEDRHVEWASAATDIATVNGNGRVEARDVGEVDISATSEGMMGALTLSVREGTTVPSQGSSRNVTLLDGLLNLTVSRDAAPPGTVVHARAAVSWPPDARLLAGSVVEIGPQGTELAVPLIVRITFVPTEIPVDQREALRLYGVDATGAWVELPTPDVELDEFYVQADLSRLTTVAIFRPVTTP